MNKVVTLICSAALGALELAKENGIVITDTAVVEVPCSGRVDEATILRTLRQGAQAVLVVGCLAGNCRFSTGNFEAHRNVDEAKRILEEIGLSPSRVEMVEVSSAQYMKLVEAMEMMADRAGELGPIRLLEGDP